MPVQRQIGFFGGIVNQTQTFAQKNNLNIQPITPVSDQFINTTALKSGVSTGDSYGANGIMHWNFHTWGDVDNVVGE